MSKLTNALNQIWYEQDGKQVKVGLTRDFLAQLEECWHILPGHNRTIKAKSPLFTMETNDGLIPVLAPISGSVVSWDAKATNFPDKLTENDVIMVLTSEKLARKEEDDVVANPAIMTRGVGGFFANVPLPSTTTTARGTITPTMGGTMIWDDVEPPRAPRAPRAPATAFAAPNTAGGVTWQDRHIFALVRAGRGEDARTTADTWGIDWAAAVERVEAVRRTTPPRPGDDGLEF